MIARLEKIRHTDKPPAEQVAEPGQFFTAEIGGESVIVVRGDDGKLRAFSNVCRHRAGPLATGTGNYKRFRCAYHGWTYALDGTLLSIEVTAEFRDKVMGKDKLQGGKEVLN